MIKLPRVLAQLVLAPSAPGLHNSRLVLQCPLCLYLLLLLCFDFLVSSCVKFSLWIFVQVPIRNAASASESPRMKTFSVYRWVSLLVLLSDTLYPRPEE